MSPGWCGSVDRALPADCKVTSSIPGQGTRLGCGPGPPAGGVREATHSCFSPSLSPSIPLSINKSINKIFKQDDNIGQCVEQTRKGRQQFPGYFLHFPTLTCISTHEGNFLVNWIWEILTFWCLLCSLLKATQEGLTKRWWEISVLVGKCFQNLEILIRDTEFWMRIVQEQSRVIGKGFLRYREA